MSCENSNQDNKIIVSNTPNFDIPKYFEKQISALSKSNPSVLKTVSDNDETEQKVVHISNWDKELSSFLTVDLNKPAYQGYIQKDSLNDSVSFFLNNKDLDLSKVKIVYKNNEPFKIEIAKTTHNFLYRTDEELLYIKDSLYRIQKKQKVIFLDSNNYKISGLIQP